MRRERFLRRIGLQTLPPVGGLLSQRVILQSLIETITGGDTAQSLPRALSAQTGLRYWVFTNSGRSALSLLFLSLKNLHPERDEVVIPAYTSYSVPAAVVRAGLRVRLCDIELETLGPSPKELERAITSRTLCVVPNHLYGIPCQIQTLCDIARAYEVPVIEDAAQALGIRCAGQPAGSFGDAALFSLSRGKPLPAAEGGIIGTNSEILATSCQRLLMQNPGHRGFYAAVETALLALFIRPSLYWIPASLPFLHIGASIYDPTFPIAPMSPFQQTLAAHLFPSLEHLQRIRQENAQRLRHALAFCQELQFIWPKEGDQGGFLRLPILLKTSERRDKLLNDLKRYGLGAMEGYPAPLSDIANLQKHVVNAEEPFPNAWHVSQQLLTLATHAWVSDSVIEHIAEIFQLHHGGTEDPENEHGKKP